MTTELVLSDFEYHLPEKLIAQTPSEHRDQSKLLHLNRAESTIRHCQFSDILGMFNENDILVMNDARVLPARFFARRKTGGRIEVFVLDGWKQSETRRVLIKPAKRIKIGELLQLENGATLTILNRRDKEFNVMLNYQGGDWFSYLTEYGKMPLPPYIKRSEKDDRNLMDKERYQTVYAKQLGAVAAPTAGLHFSSDLLHAIRKKGVSIVFITLWVGWGTFKPVTVEKISDHIMETEIFSIPKTTARIIKEGKEYGRRIISVGTTTTRALESWALMDPNLDTVERAEASIYITPGFQFRIINSLITNFHLPGSTLLMLVSALADRKTILKAYASAVENQYRFFSYGDAMFIE